MVRVRVLLTPVMVRVYEPVRVVALVVTDKVELVPVVLAGLNVAVAPLGNPLTLNVTDPVKPPVRVMVTV
jgi:hypothetical protein